ncbi:tRNA lysidine(34) synthetase TilS [filamentous cyanobacterium LEGE 11480]|uniref:tRNA(Ile)-lysidine synthase n=1 Tax=Romeriopsis navalis LEGE 11480 TaxID=2777977 RepID=A0A928VMV6_9CYAN|nr:tRNA lysidine(34) synthetase TilS [Romeriopsis navalis LEGE 11480]
MNWTDDHARLHQLLKARNLLPAESRVLIAVSGGQDSLCLLRLLLDLQPHWHWSLAVIHCDHQWRSDSAANVAHVRSLCQGWAVPIYVEVAPTPPKGEAAARNWRYQCFQEIAQAAQFDYVVTGHTASDRAETLIYNLVRGSGSDGLQSLGWSRGLSQACPQIQLVRPLLRFTRLETAEFCQLLKLPVWEDSTNQALQYARNRIRLEVLPYFAQHLNPRSALHLAQTSELLSAEVDYLESQATELYQQAIAPQTDQQLDRRPLQAAHLALQRRVMRQFLQNGLCRSVNFEQIEAAVALISAPNGSQTSTLSGGVCVRVVAPFLQIVLV